MISYMKSRNDNMMILFVLWIAELNHEMINMMISFCDLIRFMNCRMKSSY